MSARHVGHVVALAACCLAFVASTMSAQGEALSAFESAMRESAIRARLDAVRKLEGAGPGPGRAQALIDLGLADATLEVRIRAAAALAGLQDPGSRAALVGALFDSRDLVREGAARVLGRIADADAVQDLVSLLARELSSGVTIACFQALQDADSDAALDRARAIAAAESPSTNVAIAAIHYLGTRGGEGDARFLADLLRAAEDWRIRVAATRALSRLRAPDSIPVLIDELERPGARGAAEAHDALRRLTRLDLPADAARWRRHWRYAGPGLVVPLDEHAEDLSPVGAGGVRAIEYHEIHGRTNRVVFIIDISGSMEVNVQASDEGRASPRSRLRLVKDELVATLAKLTEADSFGILAFDMELHPWEDQLVPATPERIKLAVQWVEGLPEFGTSRDRERRALTRRATNAYGALRWIYTDPTRGVEVCPVADTVFFLADGAPNYGDVVHVKEIVAQIEHFQRLGQVVVHTIGLALEDERYAPCIGFMEDLARVTGGDCRLLSASGEPTEPRLRSSPTSQE